MTSLADASCQQQQQQVPHLERYSRRRPQMPMIVKMVTFVLKQHFSAFLEGLQHFNPTTKVHMPKTAKVWKTLHKPNVQ